MVALALICILVAGLDKAVIEQCIDVSVMSLQHVPYNN